MQATKVSHRQTLETQIKNTIRRIGNRAELYQISDQYHWNDRELIGHKVSKMVVKGALRRVPDWLGSMYYSVI